MQKGFLFVMTHIQYWLNIFMHLYLCDMLFCLVTKFLHVSIYLCIMQKKTMQWTENKWTLVVLCIWQTQTWLCIKCSVHISAEFISKHLHSHLKMGSGGRRCASSNCQIVRFCIICIVQNFPEIWRTKDKLPHLKCSISILMCKCKCNRKCKCM